MGNRGGVIHNDAREIVRPYKSRRWITCLLEFKGRHRVVMSPNSYTELFFLDEAVAFAAGHRPCAECRRERFSAFRNAWRRWRDQLPGADEMDGDLHVARIDSRGRKVTWKATLESLPDGTFIEADGEAWLVWKDALLLWSPEGYVRKISRPRGIKVTVLTPRPVVECFRCGYVPAIHESHEHLNTES